MVKTILGLVQMMGQAFGANALRVPNPLAVSHHDDEMDTKEDELDQKDVSHGI